MSTAALALLGWLLVLRSPAPDPTALTFVPPLNALFNSLSATFIVLGVVAARRGDTATHRRWMGAALSASACFLVGYIAYHYVHGDTPFPRVHPLRIPYLILLLTHVLASVVAFPMIVWSVLLGLRGLGARHRRIARWTAPLWLYVSVTGVLVFLMLRLA